MNTEVNKAVNELVVDICKYINKVMESDSAAGHEQLPSLIEALAILVRD